MMQHTDIAFFAVALFLALATLLLWKRRRDAIAGRLNRGLRGYVAARLIPVL
jgi:LPXTG-motif cell wall-anchored protein